MITVVSRPDDISAAYLPVVYTFTSDKVPNVTTGESSTIQYIISSTNVLGDPISVYLNNAVTWVEGDLVTLSGTFNGLYDGTFAILEVVTPILFVLDTPFYTPGYQLTEIAGGTGEKIYRNFSVVLDVYVDSVFTFRTRVQADRDDNFVFDIQRELQTLLGADLQSVGNTGVDESVNASKRFYVQYAEEYDQLDDDGDIVSTIQAFTSDSANSKLAVNSTVSYVDILDNEIISTDQNLTDFTATSSSSNFLTDRPDSISIGIDDTAQLSFIYDRSAYTGFNEIKYRVITTDTSGNTVTTKTYVTDTTAQPTDTVFHIPAGTENLSIGTDIVSYTIDIVKEPNVFTTTAITKALEFVVDRKCYKNSRRFHWVNKRGGVDSFSFVGREDSEKEVNRTEFKRLLNYPRVIPERTWTTVQAKSQLTYTTNSGLVKKEIADWLSEIVESPLVWIEITNEYLPVRILTDGLPVTNTFDRLYNVSLEWQFAFDIPTLRN